jgi:hypothetical protein
LKYLEGHIHKETKLPTYLSDDGEIVVDDNKQNLHMLLFQYGWLRHEICTKELSSHSANINHKLPSCMNSGGLNDKCYCCQEPGAHKISPFWKRFKYSI